jgi:structural maintenance of chromosome 1
MVLHRILFKLYHIQQALSSHAEDIRRQNGTLTTLREEQHANDTELEKVRADQAKSRSAVMQKEKRVKRAEKALEGKVCYFSTVRYASSDNSA